MISGYSKYNLTAKVKTKSNPLETLYPSLPSKQFDIIYADPPYDYGGKMQFDKSSIKSENINFEKDIFISSASFKYPTLKLDDLKKLNVQLITKENALLFLWTTGPQLANSIELGTSWNFEYKK